VLGLTLWRSRITTLTHDYLASGHAHVPQRLFDRLPVRFACAPNVIERDVGFISMALVRFTAAAVQTHLAFSSFGTAI
jgi:hypothetical protein